MFIVLIIFIIMDRVDIVTLIIGDGIGNVAKFDLWPPVFFYKGKLYSLVYPAYAFIRPDGIHQEKQKYLTGLGTSGGNRCNCKIVNNEFKVVMFISEGFNQRCFSADDLFFGRTDPQYIFVAGFQKEPDIVIIIIG